MNRKPSARIAISRFVSTQSPNIVAQEIDHEAKTNVLSNTASAVEGPPSSKTIVSGVPIKTKITPLHNMTIGEFEPIGGEKVEPDIREMSHRDLIRMEKKGRASGLVEVAADMVADMTGEGLHLAGEPRMTGTGLRLAGTGMRLAGYGSLPNAFYGAILPVILDALNLPADKKTLQRILNIAAVDFEKTKDVSRLVELVVEDYVKMIMGNSMSGRGLSKAPVIKKYIKSALNKSMLDMRRQGVLTGSGIKETFSKVIKAVKPYVKPAIEVGKWVYKNRDAIADVALKAAPFLMI